MKRLALFLILPLMACGAFSLALVHCSDGGGNGCPEGEMLCNDGECHPCCLNEDCDGDPAMSDCADDYIICNDEYECECICYKEGEDCSLDPAACCTGLACDIFTNTCMTECESDADCTSMDIPFAADLICKNGVCDFDHCKVDGDCEPGEACSNGDCVTIPDCDELKECVVLPGSAVTKDGTTAQFAATPYLMSGAVAPGQTFTWASDAATVASVSNGLVTGGTQTGSAVITATVNGCTISCTADVTNYGVVPGGSTRVVVVDELENTPIQGANVVVGTETEVATNQDGEAMVNTIELAQGNAADITVSHQEFNYVTMRAVEKNDVIVHMGKLHHLDYGESPPARVAGGIKGAFDFDMIRCEPPLSTCDVSFGLGGLSIPGNLVNLNFDLLIGGMIKTEIELGGSKEVVPLPSGLVLCLQQTCFKEYYTPTGIPGNRVAWGLGGKLDLADLIDKLGPVISGGDINVGELVAGLLPLFANFYTAMVPNVEVVPLDMVEDVNDIDDDENTTEVPDYDNFPAQNMTLKVKMDQTMTFNAPDLPQKPGGGYYYDGVIIIGGIIVRGAGLVPLGLSAGLDSLNDDDTPDGKIADAIVMKVADVAGRIPEDQVKRVIIALAMDVAGLAGDTDTPMVLGGQVMYVDSFSGTHDLPDFMTPAKATYAPDSGVLKVADAGAGADYTQAIFSSQVDDKNWHILGVFANGDYTLPDDPDPADPRDHGVSFINIDLGTGDYQSLVEFNDGNMGNLVELVTSFCFLEVPECYTNDDCEGDNVCDGTDCKAP